MEKIFVLVTSHPLQVLASLWLAGVSIQALCAWVEASPRRAGLLAILAVVALMTGCSTPVVRGVVAGGLVGAGAHALGASRDVALGAGVVAAAIVAAGEAGHQHVAAGGQQVSGRRAVPAICFDPNLTSKSWPKKADCTAAGGEPRDLPSGGWNCHVDCHGIAKPQQAGQRFVPVSLPSSGGPYDVHAIRGWQNRLWCLMGPDGPVVSNPQRGDILYVCSPETAKDFLRVPATPQKR